MECKQRLEQYFRDNGVPFQSMTHPPAFTAPQVAAAQHVSGRHLAKVVMVSAGQQLLMLVLPANKHVDMRRVGDLVGATDVRLAHEEEFSSVFSDCLLGAMPPFGNLYGVPVYVDASLTGPEIVFQAGTHVDTMKIRFADYARLVKPQVGPIAMQQAKE